MRHSRAIPVPYASPVPTCDTGSAWGSTRMQHIPGPATTTAADPRGTSGRRRGGVRVATLLAAFFVVGAALAPAPAAAVALVVDRTWTGVSGTQVAVTFLAYTNGTGRSTITLTGAGAGQTWTPTFRAGTCRSAGTWISSPGPIRTDASGSGTRVTTWNVVATGKAWTSTRTYGMFTLRVTSGATTRCVPLNFEHATRVQVVGMGIDLPVLRGTGAIMCNVAHYLTMANQPQEQGATFLYAHARTGMFLPLLAASKVNNGASMIGRTVYVYTSESRQYPYRIVAVRRHQTSIQRALEVTTRQLWLQTSEGPYATSTKLVVVAVPAGGPVPVAASVAMPTPHPIACRV